MEPIKIEHGSIKMIAHRGAGKVWVENSLPAFRNASKCSYWGIETDIHVTKDGNYIIIHDDTTDRVTGEHYVVEETDFETLRNLRLLGLEGDDARLPTLEEYISVCKEGGKYSVLELKNYMPEENIKEIMEKIDAMGYLDHTVFISFSHRNIMALHKLAPEQPKQYLIGSKNADECLQKTSEFPVDIDTDHRIMSKDLADEIHAMGHEVNVWTVNTKEAADTMIAAGVDYITTDIFE